MRYFVVTYIQKPKNRRNPAGGYDESAEVTKRLRNRDITTGSVILDFKDMQVVKCTVSGQIGSRDWETVHNYYLQHYRHIFERLHAENGRQILIQDASSADVDTATEPQPEQDSHKTPHVDPMSQVESSAESMN